MWVRRGQRGGLIPAHAGSTSGMSNPACASAAHPRSRGEHKVFLSPVQLRTGSSPLTRGAHRWGWSALVLIGLIPAHAGSTVVVEANTCCQRAHPRSRGEHQQ